MTTGADKPSGDGDRILFEQLAAYDDQLASGKRTSADFTEPNLDESQRGRLVQMAKTVDLLRSVKTSSRAALFAGEAPGIEKYAPLPRQIGQFEVLRELGRGGMGVVYLAEDRRLGRQVALKVLSAGLPPAPQDANLSREEGTTRLQREATILARVRHPNVVEIYESEIQGDHPYLVMEYVSGGSLKELIRENPLSPSDAARLFIDIAKGVQAVHDAGVIHRDLKPANVLLTPDRQPKVTDFGLARRLEVTDGMTKTGEFLGTPRYMAPEQIRDDGGKQGAATDVYGLGILLYESLTGRAPFLGVLQIDLMNQILHQEPISLRSVNPSVPRDLETICLKCLEKKPSHRYPTALAVSEDLERFLAGKPVLARPVGKAEQLWRWAKRNRAVAAMLALLSAGLAVAVGLVIALDRTARAERETRQQLASALTEVEKARDVATAETARAEQNLSDARQAIAKVLFRFVEDPRFQEPEYLELRKQWLADSRPVFERFLAQKPNDPILLAEQARALVAFASLEGTTGNREAASLHFREAADIYLKLLDRGEFRADYAANAGRTLSHSALNLTGEDASITAAHKEAIGLLERAHNSAPGVGAYQLWYAEALSHYSSRFLMRKNYAEVDGIYVKILDLTGDYISRHGPNANVGDIRALGYTLKAVTEAFAGEHDAALASRRQAVKIWEDVVKLADPSRKSFHICRLAGGLTSLGGQLAAVGKPSEALETIDRSVKLLEIEVRERPLNSGILQLLMSALAGRGEVSVRNGKPEAARVDFERAETMLKRLEGKETKNPLYDQYRDQIEGGLKKSAKPNGPPQ